MTSKDETIKTSADIGRDAVEIAKKIKRYLDCRLNLDSAQNLVNTARILSEKGTLGVSASVDGLWLRDETLGEDGKRLPESDYNLGYYELRIVDDFVTQNLYTVLDFVLERRKKELIEAAKEIQDEASQILLVAKEYDAPPQKPKKLEKR